MERYAYDAYGKWTVTDGSGTKLAGSAYGNRYTYTGREWDGELGLYHYRARMYSPDTGRFVSRDPIPLQFTGYSEYGFLSGKVLVNLDSSGLLDFTSCFSCRINSIKKSLYWKGLHRLGPKEPQKGDQAGDLFAGAFFGIKAEFDYPCGCCRYFQFVRDKSEVTLIFEDGTSVTDKPDIDWQEDQMMVGDVKYTYGDRNTPHAGNAISDDGCKLQILDRPGVNLSRWVRENRGRGGRQALAILKIKQDFKFLVVDICPTLSPIRWTDKFSLRLDKELYLDMETGLMLED